MCTKIHMPVPVSVSMSLCASYRHAKKSGRGLHSNKLILKRRENQHEKVF